MFKLRVIIFIVMANSLELAGADTRVLYAEREDSSEELSDRNHQNDLIINIAHPNRVISTVNAFRETEEQYSFDKPENSEVASYGMEEPNRRTSSHSKINSNKSSNNRENQSLSTIQNNKTKPREIAISYSNSENTINNVNNHRTIESESKSYQGTTDFLIPSKDKTDEKSYHKKTATAEHVDRVVVEVKNSSRLSNSFHGKADFLVPSNDRRDEGISEYVDRVVLEPKNSSRLASSFHGKADFLMPSNDDETSSDNETTEGESFDSLRPHQNTTLFKREDDRTTSKGQHTLHNKSNGFVNYENPSSKGQSSINKQTNRENSLAKKIINSTRNIVNHSADKQSQNKTSSSKKKTGTEQRKKHRLCEEKYMEYMERIFDDNDTISDGSDLEYEWNGRVLAEPGEYPHMTALGFEESNQPIDYKCGGSLISENFVLTAAHCTNLTGETPTKVRIGDLNLMVEEHYLEPQIRNISRIIKHPQYRSILYYNDIALLEMEEPVEFTEFVRPIRLWTGKESLDNISAHAMGYGATAFGKARTNRLTDMNLTIVPNDICNRELPEMPEAPRGIITQQICARDFLMNRDTCQGDSGGPLQLNLRGRRKRGRNHYHLIGITSFGLFCRSSYPSVYTRVSEYLDWIEQIVWR